eukprot:469547-Rhodomonas_salina.1
MPQHRCRLRGHGWHITASAVGTGVAGGREDECVHGGARRVERAQLQVHHAPAPASHLSTPPHSRPSHPAD